MYNIPLYFPVSQENKWTYSHKSGENISEVSYIIEGTENFNGLEVPKKIQVDNPEEYFCTHADPVFGVRDFKHHLGISPNYLIYTPATNIIPAKMDVGNIHYNTCHLFRHNSDGTIQDEGHFYDTTIFEAVENISVPAGKFDNCLKLTLIRDDVFSDIVVNVILTEWLAKSVGIVKSHAKVNIYSPQGDEPFKVDASDELLNVRIK